VVVGGSDKLDRLKAALEAAGDVAYLWDFESDRIEWSGRFAGIGLDPADTLGTGRDWAGHIYADDLPRRRSRLAEHCDSDAAFDCEYRLPDGAGGFAWVEERGRVEWDEQGRPQRMLGVLRLRGERGVRRAEPEAREHDGLTGHFDKSRLRERVAQLLSFNERTDVPSAFLAIAIENLVATDARLGHDAVDAVLIEVGRRLDLCVRVSDLIGRLGEDRFGVMLAYCPPERIAAAAQRISRAVGGEPVETGRGRVYPSLSVGAAACPEQGVGADQVIAHAESALAEARGSGGSRCVQYQPTRAQRAERRRSAGTGEMVRQAIRDGRLLFAYQPVVCATTGVVDYFECLLRVRDPDGSIVTGGDLVRTSESAGVIGLIDRFVLDNTLRELAAHPGVRLGFNVSGLTAADRRWLRSLTSLLRNKPDWARRLVVEITETATLNDLDESVRFVNSLRHAGCRVALDDFGAGHTTLQHLQSLAVDTVKIDGSLVRDLPSKPENQVFIRHLLGLARSLGFTTLAECVENAEEAAILRAEGVGFLQGYHFGRPSIERIWLANGG
jgi:diguanylate cyclase (GGDEF)-like protein